VIRQHLAASRGADSSRLEHFSDAVFAFAVTLLVVSLEVPKSFPELMAALRGFVAFGLCFAMLVLVWLFHCHFFRRYGLHDGAITLLNSVLLFFVLFYVYPLKFLFFSLFVGAGKINAHDIRTTFVVYGFGFAAVFMTFALMYVHAWRKRDQLGLSEIERLRTRHILVNHLVVGTIGLSSVLLALVLPERHLYWAGYFYFVIAIYSVVIGLTERRRERRAIEATTRAAAN